PLADNAFTTANSRNESEFYNANYWFDGNGNIEYLNRNSIASTQTDAKMDEFKYKYNKVASATSVSTADAKVNNQLFQVRDNPTYSNNFDNDIDDQLSYPNNYQYDEIGRLVQDQQENIKQINWNVSNKVTSFVKSNTEPDVYFAYGPMGNRIGKFVDSKIAGESDKTTYYMLDAQGNPIAIYKYDAQSAILTLEDFIIYGNKRLGTNTKEIKMN